jgi:hypothetical protein
MLLFISALSRVNSGSKNNESAENHVQKTTAYSASESGIPLVNSRSNLPLL